MTLRPKVIVTTMLGAAGVLALLFGFTGFQPLISLSPVVGPVLKLAAQLLGFIEGFGLITLVYRSNRQAIERWLAGSSRILVVASAICMAAFGTLGVIYLAWGVNTDLLDYFIQGIVAGSVLFSIAYMGKVLRVRH